MKALTGFAALLLAGCLHAPPPARLATPTTIAVAAVLDTDDRAGAAVEQGEWLPDLGARNLLPCAGARGLDGATTEQRLAHAAGDCTSELVLLVEARAAFYGQLEDKYRWTVAVRATLARRDDLAHAHDERFDVPVVLEFAHQGAADALAYAAPVIQRHLAALIDRTAATLTSPTPSPSPGPGARLDPSKAIYFVLVDRFANGDEHNDADADPKDPQAFYGGDLDGVTAHLDHIADLGFGTIWLSPIARMQTTKFEGHGAFHGYWVTEPDQLEPRFGDAAALQRLQVDAGKRGLGLMLDLVVNHVGWESPLRAQHPAWFHPHLAITDWSDRNQLENGEVGGLPDLALERDDVYAFERDAQRAWIERVHPVAVRLDAVRHVPMAIWRKLLPELRATGGGNLATLGELFDGTPQALADAFRDGGFDALFDFPLAFAMGDVFCGQAPAAHLGTVLTADWRYPDPSRLVTLLDNHDLPRIFSKCHGDAPHVFDAVTFQLTARGVPSMTYGTEMSLTGDAEPANRAPMPWLQSRKNRLTSWLPTLLAERNDHPALLRGGELILGATATTFAYARVDGRDLVVIAVNQGTASAPMPWTAWPMLAHGMSTTLGSDTSIGTEHLTIAPGVTAFQVSLDEDAGYAELARAAATRDRREVELAVTGDLPPCAGGTWLVAGSEPALGDWKPDGALPLPASGRVTAPLPSNGVVEAKLVYRDAAGAVHWSEASNAIVLVGRTATTTIAELRWSGASPCRR